MLALSSSTRYFMYKEPTDMRFGINSLSGLIRNKLGFDPMNGDVFVFIGKRSNQIRILHYSNQLIPLTKEPITNLIESC